MQKQVKVLIGDDTAEYGVSCASVLRSQGMYAYTRPKNGNTVLESRTTGSGRTWWWSMRSCRIWMPLS